MVVFDMGDLVETAICPKHGQPVDFYSGVAGYYCAGPPVHFIQRVKKEMREPRPERVRVKAAEKSIQDDKAKARSEVAKRAWETIRANRAKAEAKAN